MGNVTARELAEARAQGERDALKTADTAPSDPLLRIAWSLGFGQVDQIQVAVDAARAAGLTWKQIAEATGEHWRTTQTKYGGGRQRSRDYRRRKREQSD